MIRALLKDLLAAGKVGVSVDPRQAVLPNKFNNQPQVLLNISRAFPGAAVTLRSDAISARLSFDGQKFECVIPFVAIEYAYSYATGKVYAFQNNEILVVAAPIGLKAIDGGREELSEKPVERGHLRVVK